MAGGDAEDRVGRVANVANDVQMVSRGLVTSDNNRLATTTTHRLSRAVGYERKCTAYARQKIIERNDVYMINRHAQH